MVSASPLFISDCLVYTPLRACIHMCLNVYIMHAKVFSYKGVYLWNIIFEIDQTVPTGLIFVNMPSALLKKEKNAL